jgi:cell division protease FtsH
VSFPNSFWRALGPIIVVFVAIYLVSQLVRPATTTKSAPRLTYAQLIDRVEKQPSTIKLVSFDPGKRQITATLGDGAKVNVNYPSDQSALEFQNLLQKQGVNFDSKGVSGSSPWLSVLSYVLPIALILRFWLFLMNRMQGGGSRVMSFGKSRARRVSPSMTSRSSA